MTYLKKQRHEQIFLNYSQIYILNPFCLQGNVISLHTVFVSVNQFSRFLSETGLIRICLIIACSKCAKPNVDVKEMYLADKNYYLT